MTERVTHRSIQESTLSRLQGNLQAMALMQDQISSGRKITKPSDDPSGTVSSLALRQQVRLAEQNELQSNDGISWLNSQDTALQTTSSQVRAARTLVVSALNSGTANDGTRTALAVEIEGITQTVLSLANTQYQGRNLFAGTSGGDRAVALKTAAITTPSATPGGLPSYTPAVYEWSATGVVASTSPAVASTDTPVMRQVDAQSSVRVDTNGARVFGTDTAANGVNGTDVGMSLFSLLTQISDEIKTPKAAGADVKDASGNVVTADQRLSTLLTKLDTATGKLLEGLADVGARTNRIERAKDVASAAKLDLTDQLSQVEDTDIPATMIRLSMQEVAYQAALKANSKVLNTSLMDFIS